MPTIDSRIELQRTAPVRPRPACFPLAGEMCHAFTYEGDKPTVGQVCVCGKARPGETAHERDD